MADEVALSPDQVQRLEQPLAPLPRAGKAADDGAGEPSGALTRRAIWAGMILVALVAGFTPYNDYILRNSPFIGNHFPSSVVFILGALLALWNPALRTARQSPALQNLVVTAGLSVGTFFVLHVSGFAVMVLAAIGPARGVAEHLDQNALHLLGINVLLTGALALVASLLPFTRRWLRALRSPLEPGELIVIMTMMLIGAAVPSSGVLRYLEPMVVTPAHHQQQLPWLKEITALLPHWLFPFTDPDSPVVLNYWLGIDPARGGHVPVLAFILPGLLWGVLIAALMGGALFLASIFRRQWVHHERLTYPLATLPLELMAAPEKGRAYNSLWRNPVLWAGAAIPIFVYLLAGLHSQFPAVPQIDLHFDVHEAFTDRPWDALPTHMTYARLFFAVVGICFFVPSEVAFSLWLFVVINGLLRVFFARSSFDIGAQENPRAMGIYVAYFAGLLWLARGHLKYVVLSAWKRLPRAEDEPMTYRAMLGGLLGCMAVAWVWLMLAGMNWFFALLLLGVGTMLLTIMSRIVAETGLFFVGPTFWPRDFFGTLFGRGLGRSNYLWTQILSGIFYGDLRENIMPYATNALRMGQDLPAPRRARWLRWLGAALVVSALVSGGVNHYLGFTHGRNSMDERASSLVPQQALGQTYQLTASSQDAGVGQAWGHFGVGAGLATALMFGRMMWAGWPFHPIGLVLMSSGPTQALWFSVFIGWGIKKLLLRYGGAGAFRRARPFFIGLILGETLSAGMWMFVGLATHGTVQYTLLPG